MESARWASELAWRASEPAGRVLDPVGKASEQARRASEEASALGEPTKSSWESLRARWEARGDEEKREKNVAFLVCGGTIGHRPLRGHCPKVCDHWKAVEIIFNLGVKELGACPTETT